MRCSCHRAGLDYSPGCGDCRGVCANITALSDEADFSVDEAEFTVDDQTFGQ